MNRALSFVMMRNGTRASYGRKLGNSFFSPFKRVKKESFFTKFEIAFLAEWLITTAHNIIPSMPPGGWENRDGISLIPPRNGVGLEKIRILRSTSGFRGKKWVKSWYKRAKLGKWKKCLQMTFASWSLWVWLRAIQNVWFMHLQLFSLNSALSTIFTRLIGLSLLDPSPCSP